MKITYKSVSPYWVMDEIESGNEVYVLDKSTRAVETVNDMTVRRAMGLIESASENSKRYEFWFVEMEEEVENGG